MQKEIWKDVPGYEGYYRVSSFGRVKSIGRIVNHRFGKRLVNEKIINGRRNTGGYLCVALCKNGTRKDVRIHQLVIEIFQGLKSDINNHIDHIDGNKTNNRIDNLEIVSPRENRSRYYKNKKTSSKYTGVVWDKARNKWRAQITIDGELFNLGRYEYEEEAHQAYQTKLESL